MDNTDHQNGLLNILVLLADSRKSYMEMCNRVEDAPTKGILITLTWERIALETALMAEVRRVGKVIPDSAPARASTRPAAWKELQEACLSANDEHALTACERGEVYLLTRYDEALQRSEPDAATRTLLTQQRTQVQRNLNNVKSLTKPALSALR